MSIGSNPSLTHNVQLASVDQSTKFENLGLDPIDICPILQTRILIIVTIFVGLYHMTNDTLIRFSRTLYCKCSYS